MGKLLTSEILFKKWNKSRQCSTSFLIEETITVKKKNGAYYIAAIKPGTFTNVDLLKLHNPVTG